MPRQPRYFLPGYPQHVIQRGNNRQSTFRAPEDFNFYRRYLRECARETGCKIHAYVFMTNHVHLVITPEKHNGIPKLMQCLGRRYVYFFNKTYGRTGTLWEGRYKASLLDSENYLLACCRYVEMNPVRAGMVSSPGEYPHSSYRHNGLGKSDGLITPHAHYLNLGSDEETRRSAYRRLCEQALGQKLIDQIRAKTNSCRVLGSDDFLDEMELLLARSLRKKRPGRLASPRIPGDSNQAGV